MDTLFRIALLIITFFVTTLFHLLFGFWADWIVRIRQANAIVDHILDGGTVEEAKSMFKETDHESEIISLTSSTGILEFEVIGPMDETETKGEKLTLLPGGKFISSHSMDGYSLFELLERPRNYRISKIKQEDQVLVMN